MRQRFAVPGHLDVRQQAPVAAGPAWQALIPRIVGESHVARVLGVFQSAALLAGLTGAAVGGLIVSVAGTTWALLLDAVTFAALTATAVAIRTRRTPPTNNPDTTPARLLDGWRHLRTDPLVAPLFMGLLAFVVAGEITNVVEVLLVTDVLGGGAVAFGMLGAGFGLAAAAGAALGSRCTSDTARARTAVYAAAVLAAMLITAGLAPNLLALAATWTVAGLALGTLNIAISTLLVTRTPDERRGQVLATAQGLSRGCSLGATALGGLLGAALGPRPTFVWAGAAALLVSLILGLRVRKSLHSARASRPMPQTAWGPTATPTSATAELRDASDPRRWSQKWSQEPVEAHIRRRTQVDTLKAVTCGNAHLSGWARTAMDDVRGSSNPATPTDCLPRGFDHVG